MYKKVLLTLLTVFCTVALFAENQQPIPSQVKAVTIFKAGAQVNRTANASIPNGRTEILFTNLSPFIVEKTIQIKPSGNVIIQSVSFRVNYLNELERKDQVVQLEKQRDDLQQKIMVLKADLSVFTQEETLLTRNQAQVMGVQNNPAKAQDLRDLADFMRARLKEVLQKQLEIGLQIKEQEASLAQVKKQLEALQAGRGTPSGEIIVVVNASGVTKCDFTLSYYVSKAGWEPTYDIRVKDVNSPLNLFQKANLYQQTGEDWKDVKLSLSTGNPQENGLRPTLNPWWLRFLSPNARTQPQQLDGRYRIVSNGQYGVISGRVIDGQGQPLIGATVIAVGVTVGVSADVDGKFALNLPQGVTMIRVSYTGYSTLEIPVSMNGQVLEVVLGENSSVLDEVVVVGYSTRAKKNRQKVSDEEDGAGEPPVTVITLPTTYSYEIDIPVTLPSDGKSQAVDIKTYELPASYRYYCTPKLNTGVFLTADVTGWETLGLLSGSANLFFEGTYLGKSYLEFAATNDTMNISLGRDQNIVVTRTKVKEFAKSQFLSGKKEASRVFEIAVKNKKAQPVTVVVEDQFPLSTLKNIEVDRGDHEGAELEDETGQLTWTLQLEPAKEQKVRFAYKVRYPKEKIVVIE